MSNAVKKEKQMRDQLYNICGGIADSIANMSDEDFVKEYGEPDRDESETIRGMLLNALHTAKERYGGQAVPDGRTKRCGRCGDWQPIAEVQSEDRGLYTIAICQRCSDLETDAEITFGIEHENMNDNENKTNTPTIKLLPCPFCGMDDVGLGYKPHPAEPDKYHGVACLECGGHGGFFQTEHLAITNWNTRNEADALRAEVEGYRAMMAGLCEAAETVLLVVDRKTDAVDRLKTAISKAQAVGAKG